MSWVYVLKIEVYTSLVEDVTFLCLHLHTATDLHDNTLSYTPYENCLGRLQFLIVSQHSHVLKLAVQLGEEILPTKLILLGLGDYGLIV